MTNYDHLDVLQLWDGRRKIFQTTVTLTLSPPGRYDEASPPSGSGTWLLFDVGKRVYSALGLTLTAHMTQADPDHNFFELHSAKAIFEMP